MADTRTRLAQTVGTTSAATLYTVPASTTVLNFVLKVANTSAADCWVSVFSPTSGDTYAVGNAIVYQATIGVGSERTVTLPLLTAAQKVGIEAEANTSLTFTAYGILRT